MATTMPARRSTLTTALLSAVALSTFALPGAAQAAPVPAPRSGHLACASAQLDVDYESGTTDSGIEDLTTTHAPAADASFIVQGGAHGSTYAVAHKVTLGDPGYFSNGAYRSESATDLHEASRFRPGDTDRYEFSTKMPTDWEDWSEGESANGEIIFQAKPANSNQPSWLIMTKRNEIAFRSPVPNLQYALVADYRPYIGQWLDFRVDVHWAADATGYYRVWTRLPGQSTYRKVVDLSNLVTWQPANPADFGYVKWGLYRAATSLEDGDVPTRVIYHDDVRVLDGPGATVS